MDIQIGSFGCVLKKKKVSLSLNKIIKAIFDNPLHLIILQACAKIRKLKKAILNICKAVYTLKAFFFNFIELYIRLRKRACTYILFFLTMRVTTLYVICIRCMNGLKTPVYLKKRGGVSNLRKIKISANRRRGQVMPTTPPPGRLARARNQS